MKTQRETQLEQKIAEYRTALVDEVTFELEEPTATKARTSFFCTYLFVGIMAFVIGVAIVASMQHL